MANWYEDLAKTLDPQPADVATLFAGLRSSVPAYMGLYAGDLNKGEDEELLRRYGPKLKPVMPPPSVEDQELRMVEEFKRRFPTPELQQAAMDHMRAAAANRAYDPETATRRVDFAPQIAGPEMRATPRKGRSSDLMRAPMPRRAFAGGGRAKKTVQQMADELLMKGTKVADKPDLARRSLFGLKAQPLMDYPLAKLEKEFGKEGKAPTVTEKTTTVSPDAGATKSTLKSITETPISRRTVLKSAAGQALQGMMPEGLVSSPGVAGLVESAVEAAPAVSLSASAIPGLMAKLMRQGMSPEEAGREVEKMIPNILSKWPEMVGERIAAPADRLPFIGKETPLMSIFGEMVKPASQHGPYSLRPEMRGLRDMSPEDYELLKQTARDIKEYGFEP